MNRQKNILFTFLGLFLCLNVFAQHPESDGEVTEIRGASGFEAQGLAEAEKESYLKLMADMEISQPKPMGFGRAIFQEETKLSTVKKALSLGLGVSSAWAWSIVFGGNSNVGFFFGGETGKTAAPVATPLAILMFTPATAVVHELLEDLTAGGFEKPRSKKEMLRALAYLGNAGFSVQDGYSNLVVYGRVSWNSSIPKVRNSVDGGTYYLAGCYVFTNFLDKLSSGNGIINRIYNGIQQRMNRNSEENLLKKNIAATLQNQLMHSYQAVLEMEDAQIMQLRQQIGQLFWAAQTDEEKQNAKLLSLLRVMDLSNTDPEAPWAPKKKPMSLKVCEAIGGSLGFTILPWAIFSSYFAYDEDNRYDSSTDQYIYFQKLNDPNAWAYSSALGLYLAGTGLMSGRELGRKVWSDWSGRDLNQFRSSPEFYNKNLQGVRALTRILTYGVSNLMVIPVAGMATELLLTADRSIAWDTYERPHQQLIMLSVMNWAVGFHGEFDRHYQNVITNLARWRGTDPLTTARDDLRKMIIQFHDGVGELDPGQTKQLSELLEKAQGQEHEAQVADIAESSFSSSSGSGASDVAVAEKGDVAMDLGAGLSEGTDVDERAGETGLRAGLLTDAQRALAESPSSGSDSGSGGQEFDGLLDAEEGAQLLGDQSKKGWLGRVRTWLFGPDVPADLKHLVDSLPVS